MSDEPRLGERGYLPPPVTGTPSRSAVLSLSAAISTKADIVMLKAPQIVEQGSVECCVSCALTAAMEIRNAGSPPLSPLFHYHVSRFVNGKTDAQGRMRLDHGFLTLEKQGVCRASDHTQPFSDAGMRASPSQAAYTDALTRRLQLKGLVSPYQSIGAAARGTTIRQHLRDGNPVAMGFWLPAAYPGSFLDSTFAWNDPNVTYDGRHHAVAVIGFDDTLRAVRVSDSQGTAAFDHGGWWMGYRVLNSSAVTEAFAFI